MRGSTAAWLRPLLTVAQAIVLIGCSLSLRGVAGPGGTFSTPTPLTAGGPPTVSIAAPATGSPAAVGQTVDVDVRGSDPWPVGIARLELFAGDTLVDRVMAAGGANRQNFGAILEWIPLAPGSYVLSAYSYRADGTASLPASVVVTVTGVAIASASPTLLPSPSSTDLFPSPSSSDIPTVTLSPSPPPTPQPTATPTPAPIGVHIDVWVEPADLPSFTVGVRSTLVVHVQNIGANQVAYVKVVATLAGSEDRARTGALVPGQETTITMSLTPQQSDIRQLTVLGKLPAGYFDTDPQSNTLLWTTFVVVAPGATPAPTPTFQPTPTPRPTATPEPTPTPTPHGPGPTP